MPSTGHAIIRTRDSRSGHIVTDKFQRCRTSFGSAAIVAVDVLARTRRAEIISVRDPSEDLAAGHTNPQLLQVAKASQIAVGQL
jgi:hypothetical protein